MKKVYNYHSRTGEYMGSEDADPSPLEKGVYLLPAHATFTPPVFEDGFVPVFDNNDGVWVNHEDNRGHYYVHDGGEFKEVVVENIGEPKPEGALDYEKYHSYLREETWRREELYNTDKYMLSDFPISFLKKRKIKKYRKNLRNWPRSKYYPNPEYRPKLS